MLATLLVMLVAAASASAEVQWQIRSQHGPQNMTPGGTGIYAILAQNVGDLDANTASDLTISDKLPSGVVVTSDPSTGIWSCAGTPGGFPTAPGGTVLCTTSEVIVAPVPGQLEHRGMAPVLYLPVTVDPSASGTGENEVSISSEAGAASASTTDPTPFSETPAGFGLKSFLADAFDGPTNAAARVRQAGSHPSEVRVNLAYNLKQTTDTFGTYTEPDQQVRTIQTTLPLGFLGNPEATPKCTDVQLTAGTSFFGGTCPPSTQVGSVNLVLNNSNTILDVDDPNETTDVPVYNMAPPTGAVADFAFVISQEPVHIIASLDPANHYAVKATISYATTLFPVRSAHLTLWGVPADFSHDALRYLPSSPSGPLFGTSSNVLAKPFLTLPSQCDTPTSTQLQIDSWQTQGVFHPYTSPPALATGCEKQQFHTAIHLAPTSTRVNSPTGLSVALDFDQSLDPTGLGTPPLRTAVVSLPAGMAVSASSANGLGACSPAQIALGTDQQVACPDSSKIGTASLRSPLLADPVQGSVYLASPNDNPFGSLIALYLVFQDRERGLLVKLPGRVALDPATGQVTTTFDDNPQLPASEITLSLKGGPRAPLVTASTCGTATTSAQLTSWNSQIPVSTPSDSFTLSGDGNGAPCPAPHFTPALTAGTGNPVAGAFAPFSLQLTRSDDDGEFASLSSLSLPAGLLADVRSVSGRCSDSQAAAAACPPDSHIGEVTVGAGAGSDPFYVGGDVYLTGPYKGAPFGLAVLVHAVAGPFDLGYVVVRAAVSIHDDGSITTATDPLPTMLQGIPLHVRDIRVNLDRPAFIFNPTGCAATAIAATVTSTHAQSAALSSRFQVGECSHLAFHPSFTVSTAGRTSKALGASLHVHLATGEGPGGHESNIAKVEVQLPAVLPSQLKTLQKACTAAQFGADPAGCPVGSFVGTAIAHTPILTSPLSGPAILVSHGGEAFPDLVLVLQGEGVRINLTGHTQIKKGITYNHFETVPDAPVSSFDLTLPAGPHGVLTTDVPGRNLCATARTVTVTKRVTRRVNGHTRRVTVKAKKAVAAPLSMPTTMTAQNGAIIHQNTKIAVTGCAAVKKTAKKAKKGAKRG